MENRFFNVVPQEARLAVLACAFALMTGCVSNSSKPATDEPAKTESKPAAAAPAPAPSTGVHPGMDAQGNVIDPTKVESGSGQKVKVGEWEGEITGKPVRNSKFAKLKIGMSMKEATDLTGPPTDQGTYQTGKAWIPFYHGGDTYRHELTYKGQGRLIFAGGGMGNYGSGHLIWIIHSANEAGYR